MKYIPKEIREEVNVTPIHPLVNLSHLIITVIGACFLVFFGLGLVADQIATRINSETESKIGAKLLPMGLKDQEIKNDPRLPYISELVKSLHQSQEDAEISFQIHLLKDDQINAAIMPGGHIFITTGLLNYVKSENELSFVLAHELGHFTARDPLKILGRSLVFLFVTSVVDIGTANSSDTSGIISVTGQLATLNYNRKQEQKADLHSMSTIIKHYGHGGDSLQFFEKVKSNDLGNRLSEYFSTHPLTQNRIDKLRQTAIINNWQMTGKSTPLPQEFSTK